MRAERLGRGLAAITLFATSCAPWLAPEGDGGWSASRRGALLQDVAREVGSQLARPVRVREVAEGEPVAIDLASALARARRENRRLAAARAGLSASETAVTRAQGRFLPTTIASGRYTWHDEARTNQVSDFPLTGEGVRPPTVTIRDSEAGQGTAVVELPVDWAGEIRAALVAAQAAYRGEAARVAAIELEQQTAVVDAYFGTLEAQALRAVADERIRLLGEQLDNARRRFDAGRLTKNELLVVEVALADARHERYRRHLAMRHRQAALNRAIGAPVRAPTEPVDVPGLPSLPEPERVAAAAPEGSLVLRRIVEEIQGHEAEARALRRARLPRLSVGGLAEATTADVYEPRESVAGFVGFRWDLGTDLEREAAITEAERRATAARRRLEAEMQSLEDSLHIAWTALDERLRAAGVARQAVAQSEENLRIRRQQFDAGRATSEDVLDAESLLADQRASHAAARYQAHVRRAELFALIGLAPDAELAGGTP